MCEGGGEGSGGGDTEETSTPTESTTATSGTSTSTSTSEDSMSAANQDADRETAGTDQAFSYDPSINPDLADLSAFGGYGGAFSTQSTAGDQSSKGDMTGGSSATFSPDGTKESQYSRDQVPNLERMGPINFDRLNMRGKINSIIDERDKQGLYTEVTKDQQGNITGAYNDTTYTGFGDGRGTTDDIGGGESDERQLIRRNPNDPVQVSPTDPVLSDDLAVNYLLDPYYLYSGINNLYQPYGYANNTLVDLLRTRNMTQPQQRAANLGLFANPGDLS
tara:strand:+ start:25 stop:855 length:831 start_codon:yes stop_codon:yes gene_type:complete